MTGRTMRWVLAGMAGATSAFAAPPPPPALVAALSYPFVAELAAPEKPGPIAWAGVQKGIRTLWIAAGPGYRPRAVYSSGMDDGQELTGLAFAPNGGTLAWTRGGDHDANWAADGHLQPDPASSTEQPVLEIWAARTAGGAAIKIGEGDAPEVNDAGRIAFLKDGAVWVADAAGKGKPEKAFFDRGKDGSLAWSPDGTKLAFVSRRGDHSFVGIWAGKDRPLVWLQPSTAYDGNPVWSPDGTRIAFARQPSEAAGPPPKMLEEEPHPWSIWVADAATGEGRKAWASPTTLEGSWPHVPGGIFLMWGAGDRLVFRTESDGWPHLWSVAAAGGEATLLTPGSYMIERPRLAPDRRSVLFDANSGTSAGDDDRRHLFRVAVDTPGVTALSSGEGLEWGAVPTPNGIAFVSATAQRPASLFVADASGKSAHAIDGGAAAYPTGGVTPRLVSFKASDGLTVQGQLFEAPGGAAKKPAVIFVHGGPPRQMLLGWSYMDYYSNAYAMNQYLASRGFVVLSVNYRLGIGYGRAFQHPKKSGPMGGSEYLDVLAGAHFLQKLPEVDGARLGIWGGSYGGYLTAMALARNSDIFKAGVDFHGVHDWSRLLVEEDKPAERYEKGEWEQLLKVAFESSPVADADKWRSPVLFIHGDDDRNVKFNQTIDLERRLDRIGQPYDELIIPNEIHGFLRYGDWVTADAATARFLEAQLRP